MRIVKTIEFWLFALTAIIVADVVLAVVEHSSAPGRAIPYLAVVWMVFAIAWMLKAIIRKARE
jgi:hypothetical protein